MNIVLYAGALVLLAVVLYEVQNFVKAVIFALEWPSQLRVVSDGEKMVSVIGQPLDVRTRMTMALYRAMSASLVLHELHAYRMHVPVSFRSTPTVIFTAAVFLGGMIGELGLEAAYSLAFCAGAVLFASSQGRSVFGFYVKRSSQDRQIEELAQRLTSKTV